MKTFASDNFSPVHPLIFKAMEKANYEHAKAYGADDYTKAAENAIQSLFTVPVDVYFVFNGTAANVLGLSSLVSSFHSILCSNQAHIHVDECGAPEKHLQTKLIPLVHGHGKITPEILDEQLVGFGIEHHSQPKVLSVSQSTELGTVYTTSELRELTKILQKHDMFLHVDGARIANALTSLNISLDTFCKESGVSVLSLGGTKNGMMFGEAIVVLNTKLSSNLKFYRKQYMQLYSKMRYLSAQFIAYIDNDLWLKLAAHANQMAKYLEEELKQHNGIKIQHPVEANAVFAQLPQHWITPLQQHSFFYLWNEKQSLARLMCSWDTTKEDIDSFIRTIKDLK